MVQSRPSVGPVEMSPLTHAGADCSRCYGVSSGRDTAEPGTCFRLASTGSANGAREPRRRRRGRRFPWLPTRQPAWGSAVRRRRGSFVYQFAPLAAGGSSTAPYVRDLFATTREQRGDDEPTHGTVYRPPGQRDNGLASHAPECLRGIGLRR